MWLRCGTYTTLLIYKYLFTIFSKKFKSLIVILQHFSSDQTSALRDNNIQFIFSRLSFEATLVTSFIFFLLSGDVFFNFKYFMIYWFGRVLYVYILSAIFSVRFSSTQLNSAWLSSTQLNSAQLSLTQLDSVWLSLTQFDSAWLSSTQLESKIIMKI